MTILDEQADYQRASSMRQRCVLGITNKGGCRRPEKSRKGLNGWGRGFDGLGRGLDELGRGFDELGRGFDGLGRGAWLEWNASHFWICWRPHAFSFCQRDFFISDRLPADDCLQF